MSVTDWSPRPNGNAVADPSIPAADGVSARQYAALIRGVMAGAAGLALDRGGALATSGTGNVYEIATSLGLRTLQAGVALLVRVNRANTGPAFLSVDGHGPLPWKLQGGTDIPAGGLAADNFVWAIWDEKGNRWVSDLLGGLTTALFDAVMRAWWLALPVAPDGIGPNAPWRNGGLVSWTGSDNPSFTIDSPEGRRLTLRLIRDALPTSPAGLNPGEPWLNGDTIAFVAAA
ncbi:hypothetical protein [Methylobacterium organophilum]|uniref:Bacteriophage protein n=1 Tax=Methylobacterium organophilum TaxID=410 RepID=A0ABQ4TFI1_METOR|nr:hypothetical protein [Methylobacterium organophilum]GJE29816.1 hypothetical protein LKMONMHP_4702 [Methylobacterium organophilum]